MKILTPVLFAMANGTVDTLLLVNGNKVQLFKTAKGVHVNPTGFASALETLMNSKMFDSKDQATFKSVNEKMQARRDTYSTFKDANRKYRSAFEPLCGHYPDGGNKSSTYDE